MKKTINTAAIMAAAHAMTRATVAEAKPEKIDYRATFSAALAIAWEEATRPTAAQEWAEMDGESQFSALVAMTWRAKRRDDASRDDEPRKMEWITCQDDARTNAAEAWLEMEKETRKATAQELPLAVALFRAVMTAAQRIDRQERRNARALRFDDLTAGNDGEKATREYIELNAAPMAENSFSDPYTAAAFFDEIERAANDNTDRAIIAYAAHGYSQTETADRLKISQQAVNKRIRKMDQRRAG